MRNVYGVIALCSLATFFDGYDIQALGLAIPGIAEDYGVEPHSLTIAVSASLVGTALGAALLGPLGDRYERKHMLAAFLLLVGLTSVGVSLSHGTTPLAAWRFACGLGMGAIVPIAIAIVSEVAPPSKRTALITAMIACQPLGSLCAGFLSAAIEPVWGWRGIFGAGAITTLGAGVLVSLVMPRFSDASRSVDSSARTASLRALFTPDFRAVTLLIWATFCLNLFVAASMISWLPTLLGEAGWERGDAQRATGLLALGAMGGSVFFAWLIDRGLVARSLVTCFIATAALFTLFAVGPASRGFWLVLITLVGAGAIGGQMALGSFTANIYPNAIRATGIGWSSGVGRFGSIIGPIVMAAMLAAHAQPTMILALLMVPMLLCALGVFLLIQRAGVLKCVG
ncbi:MFS transporter [Rhizorhabdus dicambivorans]|uniref:MFS transporter n=1 Tax=Rhizorhabdus dicambivorans TaxID=1850238 RepID=A0A2A4FPQ8_9SPHN|nr:MFS transporter [Rhizorhabdus dicambivorans]ATE65723.1 MFS transporter [Rhizorhabdus dicambivorans]PCE39656.1 MFS transporter [Rhizorhabdus dicambivorans]